MGRRIVQSVTKSGATDRDDAIRTGNDMDKYWDRLKNLIPGEVAAIYVAGIGIIPQGQKIGLAVWAAACLIFTIIFIAAETKNIEGQPNVKHPIDWTHVIISSISFILWVYALGGPFAEYGLQIPWIAALLMLGWTFIVPYFYKGKPV